MIKADNIILIGFMGSGKTSFGKWIAKNYGRVFYDTDELIESSQKRSISDIFAAEGEEYFRELETDTLRRMLDDKVSGAVISSGGGLPLREENRWLLKQLGTVVYLKTGVDELVRRLEKDTTRPLLAGGGLEEKINRLISERSEFYEAAADIEVDTFAGAEMAAEDSQASSASAAALDSKAAEVSRAAASAAKTVASAGAAASDSKATSAQLKERSFACMYEKIMSCTGDMTKTQAEREV